MKKHFVYVINLDAAAVQEKVQPNDNISVRQCFEHFKVMLRDTLNIENLLTPLIENAVLDMDETKSILKSSSRHEQVKKLLNILEYKDTENFWNFINVLKQTEYFHVADQLFYYMKEFHGCKKMLNLGGVPMLPKTYLHRPTLQNSIKTKLITISKKETGWILICGMTGSGKSTECAAAVHDVNIIKMFTDGIFWIKFGTTSTLDQSNVLDRLIDLINKLQRLANKSTNVMVVEDIDCGRHLLRELIVSKYSNALLVLDDIHSKEYVKIFDMNIPVLVISRDCKLLSEVKGSTFIINFNELPEGRGFTRSQSEELLVKYIPQLKKEGSFKSEFTTVYHSCKGLPMVLSKILEEKRAKQERSLYSYTEDQIIYNVDTESFLGKKFCKWISFLDVTTIGLLEDFSIFPEDVKIPLHLITPLWKMKPAKVILVLDLLLDKCLLWKEERSGSQVFYHIHPLLHQYLKTISYTDSIKKHRRIINYYNSICNGEWHKLPDDGYIFKHIDYHLIESDMIDQMVEIFSDLHFLQIKIRETNSEKLLKSLTKCISLQKTNTLGLDNLKNIYSFIYRNQIALDNEDTDIVQLGLLEDSSSFIYQASIGMMVETSNQYYIRSDQNYELLKVSHNYMNFLSDRGNIFTIFEKGLYILANNVNNHNINIINAQNGNIIISCSGHTSTVRCCNITKSRQKLISSSSDCTVRLWEINLLPNEIETHKQIRRIKGGAILLRMNNEIYHSVLSNDDHLLLLICQDNSIAIFNIDNRELLWVKFLDSPLNDYFGCFSPENKYVAVKTNNRINIFDWGADKCITAIKSFGSKFCFYSGSLLLCTDDKKVSLNIYDILTSDIIKSFHLQDKEFECIALGPYVSLSRHYIATTTLKITANTGVTEKIYIWSVYSEEIIYISAVFSSSLLYMSFSHEDETEDSLITLDCMGHLQMISIKNDDKLYNIAENETVLAIYIKNDALQSIFFVTVNKTDHHIWKIHHKSKKIWKILEMSNASDTIFDCYLFQKSITSDVNLICAFEEGPISIYNVEHEENPTVPIFSEKIKCSLAKPLIMAYESNLDNLALALKDSGIYVTWVRHNRNEYYSNSDTSLSSSIILGLKFLKEFFQLLIVFNNYLVLCNTTNGKHVWKTEVQCLGYDLSKNKMYIAVCEITVISVFSSESGEKIFNIFKDSSNNVIKFTPNNNFLVYKSEHALRVVDWKTSRGICTEIITMKDIQYIQFAIDDKNMITWDNNEIKLYDPTMKISQCLFITDALQMKTSSNFETIVIIKNDGRIIIYEKVNKSSWIKKRENLKPKSPFNRKKKINVKKSRKTAVSKPFVEQNDPNLVLPERPERQSSTDENVSSSDSLDLKPHISIKGKKHFNTSDFTVLEL